jgi:FO synthase
MHAVARLVLYPYITNIQTSWVKMGEAGALACLRAGANDLGGTLMNESITRAAGASHGEELAPRRMEALLASIGRQARQRSTLYGEADSRQQQKSFQAGQLLPVVNSPVVKAEPHTKTDSTALVRNQQVV